LPTAKYKGEHITASVAMQNIGLLEPPDKKKLVSWLTWLNRGSIDEAQNEALDIK